MTAYLCSHELLIENGTSIVSHSGSIQVGKVWPHRTGQIRVDSSEVVSTSGDIQFTTPARFTLDGNGLLHSDSGRIRIDTDSVILRETVRLGRGTGSFAPIHVRCNYLDTFDPSSGIGIYGSEVSVHVRDAIRLWYLTVRAETGDIDWVVGPSADANACRFSAYGNIRIEAQRDGTFHETTLETDDRAEGESGSIHIRAWRGEDSELSLDDAVVRTGDSPVRSGDIDITVRVDRTPTGWFSPSTAIYYATDDSDDGGDGDARLTMTGRCDLGAGSPDPTTAGELVLGGLTIPLAGLDANAAGTKFSVKTESLRLTLHLSKKGTSRGKFRLVYRGDLAGRVLPNGELTIGYVGDGIAASGTVRLTDGRYRLRRVAGRLVEPRVWVSKAKASIRGDGKDTLSLQLGLATDGTVPAAASDVTLSFGGDVSVTIPAASFVRKKSRDEFRGDLEGITRVVVDWSKQTVKVTGRALDLAAIPEGPSGMEVGVAIGTDARTTVVKMVRKGRRLRY